MPRSPEHLLPTHIGGEIPEVEQAYQTAKNEGETPKEISSLKSSLGREARKEALDNAPDLKPDLRLKAVEAFQRLVKETQDLRQAVKHAKDAKERVIATKLYTKKKQEVDSWLSDEESLSFEKAYREYIRAKLDYYDFKHSLEEITRLENELSSSSFETLGGSAEETGKNKKPIFDQSRLARLEHISQTEKLPETGDEADDIKTTLEALQTIYPIDSEEYKQAKAQLLPEKGTKAPTTKKEVKEQLDKLNIKVQELWEDPMVRYFYGKHEVESILKQFAEGQDVLQMQSTISSENKLHEWEQQHQRTTIGGILVGPPGVGKTTLVRDYLAAKERNYVYIDLSEDVTRYLLYGSKSLEFKDPVQTYELLITQLQKLDAKSFKAFVAENCKGLKEVFHTKDDEAAVLYISQLEEALGDLAKEHPEFGKHLEELQTKVVEMAQAAYRAELGNKFAHIVKKNGWRDGVIISALRRGDSIIMDEFNKNKNWSLIYGLLTAKPGEEWYFADNNERIQIPENWRMYFTANIDRKHGVFEVAEALASRGQAEVMQIGYPPRKEEMLAALVALANPEGDFLRSKEDLGKLYILINEVFPKIRSYIEGKRQVIPLSYRTLRDIGEKLVLYRDPKSKKPVYRATNKSFDEAAYEVMIESYGLYENKEAPKEIANLLTSVGILLDDEKIKDKVISLIGQETYEERKKASEENKKDFEEIVKEIRGIQQFATGENVPLTKSF